MLKTAQSGLNNFLKGTGNKVHGKILKRTRVSPDTILYKFRYSEGEKQLGLKTGQHLYIHGADEEGNVLKQPYTPINIDESNGTFDLLVKVYQRDLQHPKGGKMSRYLQDQQRGDELEMEGPEGRFTYEGKGLFNFYELSKENEYNKVCMIGGGTGIVILYQVIQKILSNPEDTTQVRLLYANRSEQDILLRQELEEIKGNHPDQLEVYLTTENPSFTTQFDGQVSRTMLEEVLFEPADDNLVMHVGQPEMNTHVRELLIGEMGYGEENVYQC